MNQILVIGAHGQTGSQIIRKLQIASFIPIAGVHNKDQLKEFEVRGIAARLVNVQSTISEIAAQMQDVDAVVFSAGGVLLVDLDGKVKAAQAAQRAGINRFVLVSAGGIQHFHDDNRLAWMNDYETYAMAMYYGDMFVRHTNLAYTIIRPENLENTTGTGKIMVGDYLPHNSVSRENVAAVVVACLQNDQTIGKAFDVENGDTPIIDAIRSL